MFKCFLNGKFAKFNFVDLQYYTPVEVYTSDHSERLLFLDSFSRPEVKVTNVTVKITPLRLCYLHILVVA